MTKTKETSVIKKDKDSSSCSLQISGEEEKLRQGRKSLVIPEGKEGKNRLRYIEGTTPLKDGCWLSSE